MSRIRITPPVLFLMLCAGCFADEFRSVSEHPKAKGVIVTFNGWPPDEEGAALLLQATAHEHLKVRAEFPRFEVWVFEWDEWQEGRRAERVCLELIRDARLTSLLRDCEPDYLLDPA